MSKKISIKNKIHRRIAAGVFLWGCAFSPLVHVQEHPGTAGQALPIQDAVFGRNSESLLTFPQSVVI